MTPNNPDQPPFMQWYEGDFQLSTAGWPETAKMIYRVLLQVAWHRPALPRSEAALAKLCGWKLSTFSKYWKSHISEKFISVRGGGIQHPRIIRDRDAVKLASMTHKMNGSVGGKTRVANAKAREAAHQKAIEEIRARGRGGEPMSSSNLDPSKLLGRQ